MSETRIDFNLSQMAFEVATQLTSPVFMKFIRKQCECSLERVVAMFVKCALFRSTRRVQNTDFNVPHGRSQVLYKKYREIVFYD